jgi:putative glutamine amidotransferase
MVGWFPVSSGSNHKPRVGIPYRTRNEEVTGERAKYENYLRAVRGAGGEPVEVSLGLSSEQLKQLTRSLDAVVLTGSPADVEPLLFGATRHPECADADRRREKTDFALLDDALANQKPVLAICYGIQSLNVFLGGSLVQDIASELRTPIEHQWHNSKNGTPEPIHAARLEPGSNLEKIAGTNEVSVNSSHHQSILNAGRGLRIAARAPDGVIEGVEWTGDSNWVVGVQWHPERMVASDALAKGLFSNLMAAARKSPVRA